MPTKHSVFESDIFGTFTLDRRSNRTDSFITLTLMGMETSGPGVTFRTWNGHRSSAASSGGGNPRMDGAAPRGMRIGTKQRANRRSSHERMV